MNKANLLSKAEMKKVKGGNGYPPSYCVGKPECKECCPLTSNVFICETLCDAHQTT